MSFVHVMNGRPDTQLFQCAETADTKHDLLADALVNVSAVQLICDFTIFRELVLRDVAVQQEQASLCRHRCARFLEKLLHSAD